MFALGQLSYYGLSWSEYVKSTFFHDPGQLTFHLTYVLTFVWQFISLFFVMLSGICSICLFYGILLNAIYMTSYHVISTYF